MGAIIHHRSSGCLQDAQLTYSTTGELRGHIRKAEEARKEFRWSKVVRSKASDHLR